VVGSLFALRVIADVPIKTVQVNSDLVYVDKLEIKKIVTKFYTQGFFTVRLNEFEEELENIDWIFQANIKREWPNTLLIKIDEQKPTFRWAEQSLLNQDFVPFFVVNNAHFNHLPKLKGSIGREQYLSHLYNKYNKYFTRLGLAISSIEEDARYDKLIHLSNGIQINVGKEQVEQKIERCLLSFEELSFEEIAAIASIDLRHSNGFAVRWNT
jgi:cell division protein FtsQ